MSETERMVISTLIYADIFNYPLTKEEIWKYALEANNYLPLQKEDFFKELQKKSQFYSYHQGFYFLKRRQDTVSLRLNSQQIAAKKLIIAKHASRLLSLIPTVEFIGITGSLAMMNTREDDDIDFFIISKPKTIWITRLLIIFILQCIGRRRKRGEKKAKNKVCVNLIIDESELMIPKAKHDIYTAHEIVQITPLVDRNNTYEKFIMANNWIKAFLPNGKDTMILGDYDIKRKKKSPNILLSQYHNILVLLNPIAKQLQLWYMKKERNSEIISDMMLAFYEGSTKKRVLKEYERRLMEYKISNF